MDKNIQDKIADKVSSNKKLLEIVMGIANNHCLDEGMNDLGVRNKIFYSLLERVCEQIESGNVSLTDEYSEPKDDFVVAKFMRKIENNPNLNQVYKIEEIDIDDESKEIDIKLSKQFLVLLSFLLARKMIVIN